jgi:hypothetical protein
MSDELVSTAGGLGSSAGRNEVVGFVDRNEFDPLSLSFDAGLVGFGVGVPKVDGFGVRAGLPLG